MRDFKTYLRETKKDTRPVVLSYGRMNPVPTIGHQKLLDTAHGLADKLGAHHEIILSHSQDATKNPLNIDQKLRYARSFFPQTNFVGSSKETPTLLHHLSRLSAAGHKSAYIVAGSDRVPEFQKLVDTYHGVEGRHGVYNFPEGVHVVSAGDRDPDADGAEGMSSSKMRAAVMANDFDSYRKGIPKHVPEEVARASFTDTQNAMRKTKPIKEENVSGGDSVRGFGDVSGNPAIQVDPLQQYIATNSLAKDDQNGALMKMMKDSTTKHNLVGFKSFDPKQFEKSKGKR